MKYLLKQSATMTSVNDFVKTLQSPQWTVTEDGPGVPFALALFESEPAVCAEELFTFIARQPNILSGKARDLMKSTQGMMISEDENADYESLVAGVKRMGEKMDGFTRFLTSKKHWGPIYNGPMTVTRIWRTKNDQVVGTPEDRKLPINEVPNRLSSIVIAENDDGTKPRVMLSLSNGNYRMDGSVGEVREDFLVDLPEMYARGHGKERFAGRTRGVGRAKITEFFADAAIGMLPLLEEIVYVASILERRGVLEDTLFDFSDKLAKKAEVKAEDNPEAKYEIGGWS
ncbi:hypothetical protein phiK7B1_072 [Pseudomonas phage phiK7B1]|nr:hypothetical protein phiK7B1_072 [Pseudomonas phage phiK7B1]